MSKNKKQTKPVGKGNILKTFVDSVKSVVGGDQSEANDVVDEGNETQEDKDAKANESTVVLDPPTTKVKSTSSYGALLRGVQEQRAKRAKQISDGQA